MSGEVGGVRDVMKWDDFTDEYNIMLHDAAVALGIDNDSTTLGPERDAPQFHLEFVVMTATLPVAGRCWDPLVRQKAQCWPRSYPWPVPICHGVATPLPARLVYVGQQFSE